MAFVRYAVTFLLAAAALVPIAAAARAWRMRLVPDWTGATAWLAGLVLGLSAVVCVSELLGAIGLFRLAPITVGLGLTGVAGWWAARRTAQPVVGPGISGSPGAKSPPSSIFTTLIALFAASVVVAEWSIRAADALRHGMSAFDTLWYHMPFAARFVQQGSITSPHFVDSGPVETFYPQTSELLHALGIVFLGNDALSPLVNIGSLSLCLLAGWCVGRPVGMAPITMTGAVILMGTPAFVATQPGSTLNDIVGLTFFLTSVAVLVNIGWDNLRVAHLAVVVAALAAGIAVGTKLTFIVPIAALTVGVLLVGRRGHRLRMAVSWLVPLVATGGFWYVRNLVTVGNPLPLLHVRVGSVALPSPPAGIPVSTVAQYLFDGSVWRKFFLPGLHSAFGPAWWAILTFALAGLLTNVLVRRDALRTTLALVGIAMAVGYLFTPQALSILGAPVYFVYNVRYAGPAILLGLVLLPVAEFVRRDRRPFWLLGGYVVVLAATQFDPAIWPADLGTLTFPQPQLRWTDSVIGLAVGGAVFLIGLGLIVRRRSSPTWRPPAVAAIVLVAAILVGGFRVEQSYLQHRYTGSLPADLYVFPSVDRWAQQVRNARIAISGVFTNLQYPLYGPDLSNYVQYLGTKGPHGAFSPVANCSGLRRALNSGHYTYLLAATPLTKDRRVAEAPSLPAQWIDGTPGTKSLQHVVSDITTATPSIGGFVGFDLLKIGGPLDPAGCRSADHG